MKKFAYAALLLVFIPCAAFALDFASWVRDFKIQAHSAGISQTTLDNAFTGLTPIPRIIELDRKQPEGSITFVQYKKNVVAQDRITKGRALYHQHRALLDKIAATYNVPAPYIVALWGIETSYGKNTGGFGVIPALATLAYDGRRSEFFRTELITALKILDEGHIELANMRGSWAGAMGQNQFMPSSFQKFAVDGNHDGKRDIWTNLPDVFASTANYLHTSGWKGDERWGRAVDAPNIPKSLAGIEHPHTIAEWSHMGVTLPDGKPLLHAPKMQAWLIQPDGVAGQTFLVYDNYKVIMTWNKSTYFATSVGLLADAIAQ